MIAGRYESVNGRAWRDVRGDCPSLGHGAAMTDVMWNWPMLSDPFLVGNFGIGVPSFGHTLCGDGHQVLAVCGDAVINEAGRGMLSCTAE
jgi:hypothetical protein